MQIETTSICRSALTLMPRSKVKIQHPVVPVLVAALLCSSVPAWAQSPHIADAAAMTQAMERKVSAETADRGIVSRVLQSPEAREVANRFGLDLTRAEEAASMLQGDELARAATSARAADEALSGGSQTIVISTTALLLVLILIVLIVR